MKKVIKKILSLSTNIVVGILVYSAIPFVILYDLIMVPIMRMRNKKK